jgi:predicted HTH domain antitoxin
METVRVEIPADLAREAGLNTAEASAEAARLLAVELYREEKLSLGRAAELCDMPIEQFMKFAG